MPHIHIAGVATKNDGYWTKDKEMLLVVNIPPRVYHSCILITKDPLFWKDPKNVKRMQKFFTNDILAYNLNRDPQFYDKETNIIKILQEAGIMPTLAQILNKEL